LDETKAVLRILFLVLSAIIRKEVSKINDPCFRKMSNMSIK
jgi:hypothetical protein